MKIQHLAALILRLAGGVLVFAGAGDALVAVIQFLAEAMGHRIDAVAPISEGVVMLAVGSGLIYYSKGLAVFVCRGLDEQDK